MAIRPTCRPVVLAAGKAIPLFLLPKMLNIKLIMVDNQNLTVIGSETVCNKTVNVFGTPEKPSSLQLMSLIGLDIQIHQKWFQK